MKRQHIGAVLAGAAFAALACRGDPTSSLRGGAKSVDISAAVMFIDAGSGKPVSVVVRDEQQNPLAVDVSVNMVNTAVATVAADTTVPSPNGSEHNYIVTAVAPGQTKLVVQGGGVADTATINVLPVNFGGALSTLTPTGGDTIILASTAVLKFDPAKTTVTFGGNNAAGIYSITADTIKMLAPFSDPGALAVSNVVVTYVPGLSVTLNTAQSVTQSGNLWAPADTGYNTAPTLALPTVTGASTHALLTSNAGSNKANCWTADTAGATGPCMILKYIANGTDSLQFSVTWTPATSTSTDNSDIDIYSCGSTGVPSCAEDGGAGATQKTPEAFTFKPSAGTHYLVIERYSGGEDPNIYVTITKKN